jgi:hypothetical protein
MVLALRRGLWSYVLETAGVTGTHAVGSDCRIRFSTGQGRR